MRKAFFVLGAVILGLAGPMQAGASYSGSLSSTDGSLVVHGNVWNGLMGSSSLAWTVADTGSGKWHYQYTLTVPAGDITCVIIETSQTFTASNLSSLTTVPPGWVGMTTIGTHLAADNLRMPADVYGIRLCADVDPTQLVIDFNSDRHPVWGDFYASGYFIAVPGGGFQPNALWNAGFTAGDVDPSVAACNGSVLYHLLVPDTTPNIPAPGALVLGGLGTLLVARLRRRRVL